MSLSIDLVMLEQVHLLVNQPFRLISTDFSDCTNTGVRMHLAQNMKRHFLEQHRCDLAPKIFALAFASRVYVSCLCHMLDIRFPSNQTVAIEEIT